MVETLALLSINSLTVSCRAHLIATYKGVRPSVFFTFISAPWARSSSITFLWLYWAARCRAVWPFLSFALTFMPFNRYCWIRPISPVEAASWNDLTGCLFPEGMACCKGVDCFVWQPVAVNINTKKRQINLVDFIFICFCLL